jgi:hypothetical protein
MAVPVKVGPDGAVGVKVPTFTRIFQNGSLTPDEDNGLGAEPIAHLGERMPDVGVVQCGDRMETAGHEIGWIVRLERFRGKNDGPQRVPLNGTSCFALQH